MLAPCSNDGRNWQWIPVLDTLGLRKSTEDTFWPITVQDARLKRELEIGEDEEEYLGLCAQVSLGQDKVTLKLFAGMMDEGKIERALDFVDRLHLPKSYEIAARMAEHNRKVADLIEDAKFKNFPGEENNSLDHTMDPLVSNSRSPEVTGEDPHFVTPVANQPRQKMNKEGGDRSFKKARIF
ncbi:MAG: hypothetical protein SGBAC_013495 [Bacillariaceae sp.]